MILLLEKIVTRIPGFIQHAVLLPWKLIGSLKFRAAYRSACKQGRVYLHLGAGIVRLHGWLDTDISPRAPLYLDAKKRLPIRDSTVTYIFGEHFIEYLPRQAALRFFRESLRVLKPGGVLRISTPDIEAHARAYLNDAESTRLLNERNRQCGYQYTHYLVDIFNKTFFEDGDVCEYDTEALKQLLESAGFRNPIRCKIGESSHAALIGIERHNVGSIADQFTCVVEATKPLES
jgi:predicted SAM-dependent methyltransferase